MPRTPLHLKPPTAAWIVRGRKARGWKPRDVVSALAAQGITVTEDTVKVWESNANRRPAPDTIEALERIFEVPAPERAAAGTQPAPDLSALLDRLDAQTRALEDQAKAINRLAEALETRTLGADDPLVALAREVGRSYAELQAKGLPSDTPRPTPAPAGSVPRR